MIEGHRNSKQESISIIEVQGQIVPEFDFLPLFF